MLFGKKKETAGFSTLDLMKHGTAALMALGKLMSPGANKVKIMAELVAEYGTDSNLKTATTAITKAIANLNAGTGKNFVAVLENTADGTDTVLCVYSREGALMVPVVTLHLSHVSQADLFKLNEKLFQNGSEQQ